MKSVQRTFMKEFHDSSVGRVLREKLHRRTYHMNHALTARLGDILNSRLDEKLFMRLYDRINK